MTAKPITENTLFYGDNLEILREYIPDESVDLIYLDPPFNSQRTYNVLFKDESGRNSEAQIMAFDDTWHWGHAAEDTYRELVESQSAPDNVSGMICALCEFIGRNQMMSYLVNMTIRLIELHRVLKATGSVYLHCDPTASHYLKVVLDTVFGPQNFRSEIVWRRTNAHNKLSSQFGPIHDTILFYTKTNDFVFHPGCRPYSKAYIEDRFKSYDVRGRYQTNYLTGPGTRNGESGNPWRSFNPTGAGRHWAIPRSLRQYLPDRGRGMGSLDMLETLYEQQLIVFPKKPGGQPMYKQYVGPGVMYQDIWAYQPNTHGVLYDTDECIDEDVKYLENEEEKMGFETQKPTGILERMIVTSCNEDSVILDPFCGCGTAIVAAQKLGKRWIGIDITHLAITLQKNRLAGMFPDANFRVIGVPETVGGAKQLAEDDRFEFQWWALSLIGAKPVGGKKKKGADKGIDGVIRFIDGPRRKAKRVLVSVKSGSVGSRDIRDLVGTVDREKADIGVFVTLEDPTTPMQTEAISAGFYHSPSWHKNYHRIQILTIEELLNGAEVQMPPQASTFKEAQVDRSIPETQSKLGI